MVHELQKLRLKNGAQKSGNHFNYSEEWVKEIEDAEMKLCFEKTCSSNWYNLSSLKNHDFHENHAIVKEEELEERYGQRKFLVSVWKTRTRQAIFFRLWIERQGIFYLRYLQKSFIFMVKIFQREWGEEGFVCVVHKGGNTVRRSGERIRLSI